MQKKKKLHKTQWRFTVCIFTTMMSGVNKFHHLWALLLQTMITGAVCLIGKHAKCILPQNGGKKL
jgi:hypothetical protein